MLHPCVICKMCKSHLLQVKQMTSFRQTLPAGAKTYVCKNTLLRVAAEKQGWQTLIPATKVCLLHCACNVSGSHCLNKQSQGMAGPSLQHVSTVHAANTMNAATVFLALVWHQLCEVHLMDNS